MTNALGTNPTGYGLFADAAVGSWVMNAFSVAAGGSVTRIRFWQATTGYATAYGTSSLTGHIWHSGNTAGQTFTISLTDTAGWVGVDIAPFAVTAGEKFGVEVQAVAGHYTAKGSALPLTASGITIQGGQYGEVGAFMDDATRSLEPTTGASGSASYGLDIEVGVATLSALACTVVKTDSTHVSVSWPLPDATIPGGVTILRGTGALSTDGAGKIPSDAGYDPTTIAGVSVRATGQTTSPYSDTVPSAGTYTYWIARTAS